MKPRQVVAFEIGEHLFGLDILMIKEINKRLDFTPVFDVADYVVGTANLRGQVITILDLGRRIGLPLRTVSNRSRVIVLKTESELLGLRRAGLVEDHAARDTVGVLIDNVRDVLEIDTSLVQPPPASLSNVEAACISGVYQLPEDLLLILRLETSLAEEQWELAV